MGLLDGMAWENEYGTNEIKAKEYINLYTKLIEINDRFIFESYFKDMIENGFVFVNGNKPDNINMQLNKGDILIVFDEQYII